MTTIAAILPTGGKGPSLASVNAPTGEADAVRLAGDP